MLFVTNMITRRSTRSANFWILSILVIITTIFTSSVVDAGTTSFNIRCMEKERQALLLFKQGIIDSCNILSSWSTENHECCKWRGIACDQQTDHVTMLDLSQDIFNDHSYWEKRLAGTFNLSSLLELQHLSYLNLSYNDFIGSKFPKVINHFSQLKELKLAGLGFVGPIPYQIGNLSHLHTLDLSVNFFSVDNLDWLSGLSSLRSLDLSFVDLSKVVNWPLYVSKLPFLSKLRLGSCDLQDVNPKLLPLTNYSTSPQSLDLSQNSLSSSIFHWIANFTSNLGYIDLNRNLLKGPIPDVFTTNMVSLVHLDLYRNQLEGGVPKSFRNLCSLEYLDLSSNGFTGRLDDSVNNLSCAEGTLKYLKLSNNPFLGPFPNLTRYSSLIELQMDNHGMNGSLSKNIGQHDKLERLSLVDNQLSGPLPDFSKLSSLRFLYLENNQLNGSIPKSMGQLSNLVELNLSNNSLNGSITEAHFSNLSRLKSLKISKNNLSLSFSSEWTPPFDLEVLSMTSCKVGPAFPKWLRTQKKLFRLNMARANISDSIPDWFWNPSPPLQYLDFSSNQIHGMLPNLSSNTYLWDTQLLDLSSNQLSGPLPPFPPNITILKLSKNMLSGTLTSLCETQLSHLQELHLSDNRFSGELPDCWMQFKSLFLLNLENNNLSGKLPASLGYLSKIGMLHLRNNNFIGELSSLRNFTYLSLLDLGENRISGRLPEWLVQSPEYLLVLRLRSNQLYGSIPTSWCSLRALRILDLSHNNLYGALPHCFSNMTAMTSNQVTSIAIVDSVKVVWKAVEREFGGVNSYCIDISSNELSGVIPESITSLLKLISLNLSTNNLTGRIPRDLCRLSDLESLDLSRNQIFGTIPAIFSNLYFLSWLNLSYNNLTGRIPTGRQLQTFPPSAFTGNRGLFGPPLTEEVPKNETKEDENMKKENDEDQYVTFGLYVSIVIGFIVGFWGVCGSLILRSSWRHAYFQCWNRIKDWLYVTTRVFKARLIKKLTRNN